MSISHHQVPEYSITFGEIESKNDLMKLLYAKCEEQSWKTNELSWDAEYDPSNPMKIDDHNLPIFNTALWNSFTEEQKAEYRIHSQALMLSNMVFSEGNGATVLGKVISMLPDHDSRMCMSSILFDEFRHGNILLRVFNERFGVKYPPKQQAIFLLDKALKCRTWYHTYFILQIFEICAALQYGKMGKTSNDILFKQIFQKMQSDESRHMAFSNISLDGVFNNFTPEENLENENLILELVENIGEYFGHHQLLETLGYDKVLFDDAYAKSDAESMKQFLTFMSKLLYRSGIWTDKLKQSFEKMGLPK